jgi:BirA family transcriptional regulator, biotin operon repressor / biotin---[acetyl-CoA-carboxylase] ligase
VGIALSPAALAAGQILHHRRSVTSTMDEARALLNEGHHGPFWVVADEQTGGRGRHGRQWSSPPGNLYVTLALTEPCEPGRGPELGFVAGVALHRAAAAVTGLGHPALALKWPNDLLLNRAKCAGLLLEGVQMRGAFHVLIGFGVNVMSAPEGTPYPATALFAHEQLWRDGVLAALSGHWLQSEKQWRAGFAATRAAWIKRAAFLGERITVRPPSGEISGVMRGIDGTGRLLMEHESGLVTIDAGDLLPPRM